MAGIQAGSAVVEADLNPTNAHEPLMLRKVVQELAPLPFPMYSKPVEVGCFSTNDVGAFVDDDSEMLKYSQPDLSGSAELNLSDGYPSRYIEKDEDKDGGLDNFLNWVRRHKRDLVDGSKKSDRPPPTKHPKAEFEGSIPVDFVTWRGVLRKMMTMPYCEKDEHEFAVIKHNGTIYIKEVETEAKCRERKSMSDFHKKACFWGRRFEGFCTTKYSDKTGASEFGEAAHVVNTHVAYCSVVSAKLGGKRLLMSGEVDCVDCRHEAKNAPPSPIGKRRYIELKTQALIKHDKQRWIFERHKLLTIWAQSFLPNVPTIIIGFRDQDGYVQKLQEMKTSDIPKFVKGKADCWNPAVCMNFLDVLLSRIKAAVDNSASDQSHTITMKNGVICVKKDPQSHQFLPKWYTESSGSAVFDAVHSEDEYL